MEVSSNDHREPILAEAWRRHAEMDANADKLKKKYVLYRRLVMVLGVLATFLAIFVDMAADSFGVAIQAMLKVLLIATPLLASMIAAYTSRELGDGRWLAMRAGTEEIIKEIYIFRTVLKNTPHRRRWLSNRLAVILRQVYKSSSNKLDTEPYQGSIPTYYNQNDPNSDPGFKDLTPDEYIRFRLRYQLSWHEKRLVKIGREKRRLTIAILAMGAMGALLAGIGGPFTVWVALTASITAALTGWEELQNREATITNYSKVKLELTILKDHWAGLTEAEKTDAEFYKMVLATENLLWMQNAEYIRSMQEALASYEDEDARLVEDVVRESESMHRDLQESLYSETASVMAYTNKQLSTAIQDAGDSVEEMVSGLTAEAMAYTDSAETVVDAAVDESAAVRTHIEATVTTEVEAWADSSQETVDAVAAESAQIRESAETAVAAEVEAWSVSADQAIEKASAESAEIRESAAAAVTAETEAWSDTTQAAIDAAAETSEAARQMTEGEVDAWQSSAQEAMDAAVEQSARTREVADQAVDRAAEQSEAWQVSAKDAVSAAAAESDAWRESADQMVETAVDSSTAARETMDRTVKYALDFKPAVAAADDLLDDFQEQFEEVVYTAQPGVKYAITFETAGAGESSEVDGEQADADTSSMDDAVNKAVDRILKEGVNVADDAIKEALADASQEENE